MRAVPVVRGLVLAASRSPRVAAAAPGLLAVPLAAVLVTGVAVAADRGGLTGAPRPTTAGLQGASRGAPARVSVAPARPATRVAPVAALTRLYLPDLLVDSPRPLTPADLAAVGRLAHVQGVTSLLTGTVRYAGRAGTAWAVDPSGFRAFTPRPTAASDGLWQAVARGELVVSYDANRARKVALGSTVPVAGGSRSVPTRIGALAELGVPGVEVLLPRSRAAAVGLRGAALLISVPGVDAGTLQDALTRTLGGPVGMHLLRAQRPAVFSTATAHRATSAAPGDLRTLYQAGAGTCPGLPWSVLAAIGQIETDHGRSVATSPAGAQGPMQFMPATWRIYGVDGNGDGVADINNQADAIYSAARYLCASGAGQGGSDLYNAIFAYNHADWYVRKVLALAGQYH